MKRSYMVTFDDSQVTPEFPTWQQAYSYAKKSLRSRPAENMVVATVTGFMADGRFGTIAEFWIPKNDGQVVRLS